MSASDAPVTAPGADVARDDEESDDEVRHPLIVHDRDPEQNLEALRDPSRYRQNLA